MSEQFLKNQYFENRAYTQSGSNFNRQELVDSQEYKQSREDYFKPTKKFYMESVIPRYHRESLLIPERDRILARAIDISNIETAEADDVTEIRNDFDGNFMYHGVNGYRDENMMIHQSSEVILDIIQEGCLQNARAHNKAKIKHHPGAGEGISWNFNGIGVLPGHNFHLAGFLTSPKLTLGNKREKLIVPDDAAPYEARQVADDKDSYDVSVNVEDTYFVCAQGDVKMWADIFAICKLQNVDGSVSSGEGNSLPKRILFYDESDIAQSKWTVETNQDYKKFEYALRNLIPTSESTVSWNSLLGKEFNPSTDMDYEKPHRVSRNVMLGRAALKYGKLKSQQTARTFILPGGNWR